MEGSQEPVGGRNHCTLFLGQRGMGKTALLLGLSDRATKAGYMVAQITAHEGMPKAIKASDNILDRAALATGFPYLMQLIG